MFPFVYSQSYSASPRLRATNHLKHQENLRLERWPEVRSCIWIIGCPLLPFSCHVVRSLRAGNHSICHRLVLYSIDIAKTRLYYNRHLHNLRFALLKFWVRCLETHFFHFLPTYFLVVAGLQWYTGYSSLPIKYDCRTRSLRGKQTPKACFKSDSLVGSSSV